MKLAVAALCLLLSTAAQAATKLVIGSVPTIGDGPMICAIEKGYFAEQGLDVELAPFRSGADMIPMIARGDISLMGGAMSAAFFNAIADGMPIRYFSNRAQSPVRHSLVLRKEIAASVKGIKDLKGRRLAIAGTGSQTEYETAKILAVGGLSLDDIELKSLGMPEIVAALASGAVDAAVLVPPLDEIAARGGGVRMLDPDDVIKPPMEVSGMFYNTDWAKKNPEVLDRFALAYIKGVRFYLEAARRGPNRAEMIDYLIKHTPVKDRAVYESMAWSEASPDGAVTTDSIMDMQDFYAARGYLKRKLALEEIHDGGPIRRAVEKLGSAAGK